MTDIEKLSIQSSYDERKAQVYYGHLLAEVERSCGENVTKTESLAIAWISGQCVSRGGQSHQFSVDGLNTDTQSLGSWRVTIRILNGKRKPIDIIRHNLLAAEGETISLLAKPLLSDQEDEEKFNVFCISQIATLCTRKGKNKKTFTIKDSEGHTIHITAARKAEHLNGLRYLFPL
jgi:hypothetical protein